MFEPAFRDRVDAGCRLAARLGHLADARPVVLGLPRGGVVVAAEVARALDAPLDVLVVRKIPAPRQPELALGAVTCDGRPRIVRNESIIATLGVSQEYLDRAIADQLAEVRRRQTRYRGDRPAAEIAGRTVIVVDDGIATGATVQAALATLRQTTLDHLVLAVPVGPPDVLDTLQREVDELVCLSAPACFAAVGAHYERFEQTSDAEVIALLERARPSGR